MTRSILFALVVVGLWLLSGCGGGGGGGSTGGGGTVNLAPGQYIEFLRSGGGWFDPFNLQIGDSGTAVLANYDSLGNRTELVASNWTTTGVSGVNINGSTGAFTVVGTSAGEFRFQTTSVIFGTPTLFEQRGRVPTAVPEVRGRVVELSLFTGLPTNTGIPHLNVDFFDAGGNVVGSARTMADGRFSAQVPQTAIELMVDPASIKSKYYKSVYFEGDTYSPLDTTCRIAVTVGAGVTTISSSAGLPLSSGTPPPPPTGCT